MAEAKSKSYFPIFEVPDVPLILILSFLQFQDLKDLRLVCRRFFGDVTKYVKQFRVWKFDHTLIKVHNVVEDLLLQNWMTEDPVIKISISNCDTKLTKSLLTQLGHRISDLYMIKPTDLEKIHEDDLPNLKTIKFAHLRPWQCLKCFNNDCDDTFPTLLRLTHSCAASLQTLNLIDVDFSVFTKLHSDLPCLKQLRIEWPTGGTRGIWQLISRGAKSLETLDLIICGGRDLEGIEEHISEFTKLKHLTMILDKTDLPSGFFKIEMPMLNKLSLDSCNLTAEAVDVLETFQNQLETIKLNYRVTVSNAFMLLWNQQQFILKLKHVEVIGPKNSVYTDGFSFQLINRCCKTLSSLTLNDCDEYLKDADKLTCSLPALKFLSLGYFASLAGLVNLLKLSAGSLEELRLYVEECNLSELDQLDTNFPKLKTLVLQGSFTDFGVLLNNSATSLESLSVEGMIPSLGRLANDLVKLKTLKMTGAGPGQVQLLAKCCHVLQTLEIAFEMIYLNELENGRLSFRSLKNLKLNCTRIYTSMSSFISLFGGSVESLEISGEIQGSNYCSQNFTKLKKLVCRFTEDVGAFLQRCNLTLEILEVTSLAQVANSNAALPALNKLITSGDSVSYLPQVRQLCPPSLRIFQRKNWLYLKEL